MGIRSRCSVVALAALALLACDDKSKNEAKPEPAASAAPAPSAAPEEAKPAGAGCRAESSKPMKLGVVHGYVYGFAGDEANLYYSTWQLYGSRGDVGRIRKDGEGKTDMVSLSLEPRGLLVDDRVYYTAGIRLFAIGKDGGEPAILHDSFSSQSIAMNGTFIFGVPGDYGPYDRLVRIEKKGGASKELDVSTRPDVKEPPSGFSAIAADDSGVYVTDSGENRVLRFQHDRAKPKVLASKQEKAYDLVIDADSVYFTLAKAGKLLKVSKNGGTPKVIATGLENQTQITSDTKAIYTTLAAKAEDAPQTIVKIGFEGGAPNPIAVVPHTHVVDAITLDDKCVYWAERDPETRSATVYAIAR